MHLPTWYPDVSRDPARVPLLSSGSEADPPEYLLPPG